jgi:hypothetical protein
VQNPADSAENIERKKLGVIHLSHAGHKRRERADDGNEARVNDGLAAMLFVESLRLQQMLPAKQARIGTLENVRTRAAAERIAGAVADDGRRHQQQVHINQIQMARARHHAHRE